MKTYLEHIFVLAKVGLAGGVLSTILTAGPALAQQETPSALVPVGTSVEAVRPPLDSNAPAKSPEIPEPAAGRIRIGSGDLFTINVFDIPELSQEVRVGDDGEATLNLLGTQRLAGLTVTQAEERIAKELRDRDLVVDPQVTILIREYGTQGISVLGEVKTPGRYPIIGSHSLLNIISLAGGLTSLASKNITVKRRASQEIMTVNISNDSKQSLENDIEIEPGDTIVVPKAGIVFVVGEVQHAGGFVIQNDGTISLLQAVALGGGPQRNADLRHTKIIRKAGTGYQEAIVPLGRILQGKASDVTLRPDDIVFIPNSKSKSMATHLGTILQSVSGAVILAVAN